MSDSLQKSIEITNQAKVEKSLIEHRRAYEEAMKEVETLFVPSFKKAFHTFLNDPEKCIEETFYVLGTKGYVIEQDLNGYGHSEFHRLDGICGFDNSKGSRSLDFVKYDKVQAQNLLKEKAMEVLKDEFKDSLDEFDWEIVDVVFSAEWCESYEVKKFKLRSHKTLREEERKRLLQRSAQLQAEVDEQIQRAHLKAVAEKEKKLRRANWLTGLGVFVFLTLVPAAGILLSIESGHLTPEQVLPPEWVEPFKNFFNIK